LALRYYDAGSSIRKTPVASYASDFSAMLSMGFSNAPNVFSDVYYESTYGSKTFTLISQVRVDAVFDPTTGKNLGDDFKKFIFDTSFTTPYVGQLFRWKNSYWMGINSDNYESLSKSLVCRRCNNVLRWKDEYNNLITEPCIMNYDIGEAADYTTSQMVTTAGFIKVSCQRNSNTNTIQPNRRFLFGAPENRSAYKIYGNGRKLYLNSETENESSPAISEFYMGSSFINESTDDIINGIADAYRNEYTLSISDGDIVQLAGFSKTLVPYVYHNGEVVSADVVWSSSDEGIVAISSSGEISCVSTGESVIRCSMYDNSNVYDEVTIYVVSELVDDYEITISPDVHSIYEGESQEYTCYLKNNDVILADTFVFTATGVPADYYRLRITDGNTFSVENIEKYLIANLAVTCTSGEHTKTFSISLRGDF